MSTSNIKIPTPQGAAAPLSQHITAARRYMGENATIYAVRPAPDVRDTTRVQFVDPDPAASSGPK